jgi:hypothetical protein
MRLITWKRLGIIASVIWVVVGPTYFHLSREDNEKRIARDQYQRCIKQAWTTKGGVERCNKDLRQALAVAHWTSWAQLALIPLMLAWVLGWGLYATMRRVRGTPQEVRTYPRRVTAGIEGPSRTAEQLQSVPARQLNVSEEQYRAIGHVSLQWAFLEGEIDRELVWLNKRSDEPVNLNVKFADRIIGWRRLAALVYAGHPELIDGVTSIAEKAAAIKPERDKLIHCQLVSDGMMVRIRKGRVLEISDEATAPHIMDLACRISDITAEIFRHQRRLAWVFDNPL